MLAQDAGPQDWIKIPWHFKVDPPEYKSFMDLGFGDIFELDMDRVIPQHRLWDQVGANPSDFFNFGLNRHSWLEYCARIRLYRKTYHLDRAIRIVDTGREQTKASRPGSCTSPALAAWRSSSVNPAVPPGPAPGARVRCGGPRVAAHGAGAGGHRQRPVRAAAGAPTAADGQRRPRRHPRPGGRLPGGAPAFVSGSPPSHLVAGVSRRARMWRNASIHC